MRHPSQTQGEVGDDVNTRNHFEHRQRCHRGQRVGVQLQRGGAFPGAFHHHVLQVVPHQFADARGAVHIGNDFEQEVGLLQRGQHFGGVERAVFVAHGASGNAHWAVVERAQQGVGDHAEMRLGELFRKAPDLASAGNRRFVVEIHRNLIGGWLALVEHGYDLAGFGVRAKTSGVGHVDELELHQIARGLQRLGNHGAQHLGIGAVGHHEKLAVDETIRAGRVGGAGEGHGKGGFGNVGGFHEVSFGQGCGMSF